MCHTRGSETTGRLHTSLDTGTFGHLSLIVQSYAPSVVYSDNAVPPPGSCQNLLDSLPTTLARCTFGIASEAEVCVKTPIIVGRSKCDGLCSRQSSGFFLAH